MAAADSPRVLIVEDHDLFRRGLRAMLESRGVTVVGESRTAEPALGLVEQRRPQVVLMDLNLPGMSGSEATRRITDRGGAPAVLVLTASSVAEDVIAAIEAGAAGYLLKDAPPDEIVRAIRSAIEGEAVLGPEAAATLVARVRSGQPTDVSGEEPELSERELDLLRLLVAGKENAEIGKALHLSPVTVKHQLSAVFTKLGVTNRVQAAVYAARRGLV